MVADNDTRLVGRVGLTAIVVRETNIAELVALEILPFKVLEPRTTLEATGEIVPKDKAAKDVPLLAVGLLTGRRIGLGLLVTGDGPIPEKEAKGLGLRPPRPVYRLDRNTAFGQVTTGYTHIVSTRETGTNTVLLRFTTWPEMGPVVEQATNALYLSHNMQTVAVPPWLARTDMTRTASFRRLASPFRLLVCRLVRLALK